MRGVLAGAILALGLVCAQSAAAQIPPPGRVDPSTPPLEIRGWARSVASTGTTYYNCQETHCGPGSTVSVRRQPSAAMTPEWLGATAQASARAMGQRFGPVARITVGTVRDERLDGDVRTGEVTQDLGGVEPAEKMHPAWTQGFVAGPCDAYSIGSSAETRPLADRNFKVLQAALTRFARCRTDT